MGLHSVELACGPVVRNGELHPKLLRNRHCCDYPKNIKALGFSCES